MKKRITKYAIWGVAITAFTMLLSYEHCMDGPGRGLPFAAYTPVCGAWIFVKLDNSKIPQVFDFGALIVDMLFWAVLAGVAGALSRKRRSSSEFVGSLQRERGRQATRLLK